MTKLLEKAFQEASKLSVEEQDALARAVLGELASERRWDELFAASPDLLHKLASDALAEHIAGRAKKQAASETLEILTDRKLYPRLRRTAETLEDDVRKGRLGSLEEGLC